MKVKNITTDALGWGGHSIPAGAEVDVPEGHAKAMVARNPQKFALVEEVVAEPERTVAEAPNRMQRGGRTR